MHMIRVLIGEQQQLMLDGLTSLFRGAVDFDVCAAVLMDGGVFQPTVRRHQPDVTVMGFGLLDRKGVDTLRSVRRLSPGCKAVVAATSTTHGALHDVAGSLAEGLLLKEVSGHGLLAAVRAVAAGRSYLDPRLKPAVGQAMSRPLTGREHDVLSLAATGASPCEIARELTLSLGTVRNHMSASVRKLRARTYIDAVRIQNGKDGSSVPDNFAPRLTIRQWAEYPVSVA
jgi:two-component system, NarL family, response regulator DesR